MQYYKVSEKGRTTEALGPWDDMLLGAVGFPLAKLPRVSGLSFTFSAAFRAWDSSPDPWHGTGLRGVFSLGTSSSPLGCALVWLSKGPCKSKIIA